MPETTLILPTLALLLPGVLAYVLGRRAGRIWPGIVLACAAIGWGGWLVCRSALVGMAFARFRPARAR